MVGHSGAEAGHVGVFDFRRLVSFSHSFVPPSLTCVRIDYSFWAGHRQTNITSARIGGVYEIVDN